MNGLKHDDALDDEKEEMYNNIEKVLLTIKKNEHSWPFLEAVEEVNTPDFFEMIKEPMDLLTIERKVEERVYERKEEFERDVNLVFDNCIEYHGAESDFGYMAENLKGVFDRSMRRVFRVYLEPAWRRTEILSDYASFRSQRSTRKRSSYRELDDSDSESEHYQRGKIMYSSGRRWGEDDAYKPDKDNSEEEEETSDKEKGEERKPRATWSYRRDMGQEAQDFESYIPCRTGARQNYHPRQQLSTPAVEYKPPDLSKYAGAKFRVASHKEKKKASLPLMIINQYVKKARPGEGGGDAAPVKASAKAPPPPPQPPVGAKPPVKVVKISKEEYEKLLAQNKLKVLDANNPAGKVIKLLPGMQLKAMSPAISSGLQIKPVTGDGSQGLQLKAASPANLPPKPSPLVAGSPSPSPSQPAASTSSPVSSLSSSSTGPQKPPAQPLPVATPGRKKRGADGTSGPSPAKKVDIKDRLRLINEKLGHRLRRGATQNEGDGSIITRQEMLYADSKVVNGQTFLNVASSRGG
ncbi:hypothetical protein EGW08_010589, partial [Elysia chlorotica]